MTTPADTEESPEAAPMPLALTGEEEAPPRRSANSWMVTFADVLALLLTFFVMMYAMNDVREDEWQGFVSAMSGHFNPAGPPADFQVKDGFSDTSEFEPRGMDLGYLESLISAQLKSTDAADAYSVVRRGDRLLIRLPEVLIIEDGRPMLTPTAQAAARELGQVLGTLSNGVSVAGHAARGTDGVTYPSAWELSLAAATIVADTIRDVGFTRNILVLGHGDAYLKEEAASRTAGEDTEALSWARVDIVVRADEARELGDES